MEKDLDFSGHYCGHHCGDLFCVSPTIHARFLMTRAERVTGFDVGIVKHAPSAGGNIIFGNSAAIDSTVNTSRVGSLRGGGVGLGSGFWLSFTVQIFQGFDFVATPSASAFSTSRRMASDLLMPISLAQELIAAIIFRGKRAPNRGSFPVAGRPLFLGLTFIDFAIKRLYLKSKPRGSANFRPGEKCAVELRLCLGCPDGTRSTVLDFGRTFGSGLGLSVFLL
jgi:hypothetical protein